VYRGHFRQAIDVHPRVLVLFEVRERRTKR